MDMKKLLTVIALASILNGCGGGGGGSSTGTGDASSQSLKLTLNDLSTQVSEESEGTIRISTNKSDVSYELLVEDQSNKMVELSSVEPGLSWSVDDGKLTINGDSINKSSRTVIATIRAISGDDSAEATFNLELKNTSLDKTIEKVGIYVNNPLGVMDLTELNAISDAYLKVLDLLGVSASELNPTFDSVRFNLSLSEIDSALVEVSNGADEDVLDAKVILLESQINEYANQKVESINALAAMNNSLMTLPEVAISFDGSKTSFFIGNSEYGSFTFDGVWQYSSEYQFVGRLTDLSQNNCSI